MSKARYPQPVKARIAGPDNQPIRGLDIGIIAGLPQQFKIREQKSVDEINAAYILSDEIIALRLNLERAEEILHDVSQEYFGAYSAIGEEDCCSILCEFSRYKIRVDIVCDYLFGIRNILKTLSALTDEAIAKREEAPHNGKHQTPEEQSRRDHLL